MKSVNIEAPLNEIRDSIRGIFEILWDGGDVAISEGPSEREAITYFANFESKRGRMTVIVLPDGPNNYEVSVVHDVTKEDFLEHVRQGIEYF